MSLNRRVLANAIRTLSMDAVQKAKSGHPGAPMGMADIAEVLWRDFLRHNPNNPNWANRDRFVLSNGHGSMLLYSLLHLTGYDVSIDDIKNFRQLHSKTAGHPEYRETPGVETTTGPLGQGLANAVGMALGEKMLGAQFNKEGHKIVDHFTYVFTGDGCLMEGISHEVCSLASTLGLGKLIVLYDDNGISIDGEVQGWFSDDTPKRFEAYGWHVEANVDGHDSDAVAKAIQLARSDTDRPSIICCRTTIGFGSPNKAGTAATHGAPLGDEEIWATRKELEWDYPPFEIPTEIRAEWDGRKFGREREENWQERFDAYKSAHPELAKELERRWSNSLSQNWSQIINGIIEQAQSDGDSVASRKASLNVLNKIGELLPEFVGGSADLTGSNLTKWKGSTDYEAENPSGSYIYYGVREFGMSAIMNGLSLYGGFIPFGGTFLIFMEYARNAVRMASLMKLHTIFVYTHDSIGLGEDGPTHQAVEQIASLRCTPNLSVWRPCDAVETAVAWKSAVENSNGPTALILSRQTLAHQERTKAQVEGIERGAYVIWEGEAGSTPDEIFIATGSEVALAIEAAKTLKERSRNIRVVSMPSVDRFEAQSAEYREEILPAKVERRLAIEAGIADYWYKFVGLKGGVVGMRSYGASAPAPALFEHFGFNLENVVKQAEELIR